MITEIKSVTKYFMETRGQASQAVSNAILIMIKNIESHEEEPSDVAVEKIINSKNNYLTYNNNATKKALKYSIELIKNKKNILVYDYSSTVEKVLVELAENEQLYTVYIPESRIINGELPFLVRGYEIKFAFLEKYREK